MNALNRYFSTVGTNIANRFVNTDNPMEFLTGEYPESFFFTPVTFSDVISYIKSLKNKKCSVDSLPAFVLRRISNVIAPIFCHLVNLSITTSTFPDFLKIARVVPLPKGGDSSDVSNYRPISVLHIFSKIIEKHAYKQLYSYL